MGVGAERTETETAGLKGNVSKSDMKLLLGEKKRSCWKCAGLLDYNKYPCQRRFHLSIDEGPRGVE